MAQQAHQLLSLAFKNNNKNRTKNRFMAAHLLRLSQRQRPHFIHPPSHKLHHSGKNHLHIQKNVRSVWPHPIPRLRKLVENGDLVRKWTILSLRQRSHQFWIFRLGYDWYTDEWNGRDVVSGVKEGSRFFTRELRGWEGISADEDTAYA